MVKKYIFSVAAIFLICAVSAGAQTPIRINVGGSGYRDSKGQIWSADSGFNNGKLSFCAPLAAVTGTPDPQLYKNARYGEPAGPELQYAFAVPNGAYTVNLYFAETCSYERPGSRLFDVQLQGATTFPAVDIAATVGLNHPLVKSANVSVIHGQLTIRFLHRNNDNNPIISAIEILPAASSASAPQIKSQPFNESIALGHPAVFSVVASGAMPLSFQWLKGNSPISGANSASYTTPATNSSDNGSHYSVVVTNSKGHVTSSAATLILTSATTAPSISEYPASQVIAAGETATFSVSAVGSSPLSYQWHKNGYAIGGANAPTYITPPATSSDNGSQFTALVTNTVGSATTSPATLMVTEPTAAVDVTTYHNDNGRTGQNLTETTLNPANVNSNTFGLQKIVNLDGRVDAQPLFLSGVAINRQGTHDVVYVATEHDSVYALDAVTGAVLWRVSTLGNGERPSDDRGCGQVSPEIGITSTPVIDRNRGPHGAIYVVAMSKHGGTYSQRLFAFDLTSGAELFGGPQTITANYPGVGDSSSGGNVIFEPAQYKERAGLLLLNGQIITTWASHCDARPYTGWVMSFDANSLQPVSVLNLTPNGNEGAMWMSGAAPAADSNGNIFLLDGNGTMDTSFNGSGFPAHGDFGNCFCKIATYGGLRVADYFELSNTIPESNSDTDLGSGAALVLPDLSDGTGNTLHLAMGAGKDGNIYLVNRDNMGKFDPNANHIHQELHGAIAGAWSMAAYFNHTVYYATGDDVLKAFTINNGLLSGSPTSRANNSLPYPGATPSISANGTSNGIVWVVGNSDPAVLDAYDASNLSHELYNSNANAHDRFGNGNKFITPTIAKGHVYVGTPQGVAIFGLP